MNKYVNRGGRPRLANTDKKKYTLPPVHLDVKNYYLIKARVRDARMSLTQYQREMLLQGQVVERLSPEQMELCRQLAGMANNMNQLAHQANKYGYHKDAEMYRENVKHIINLIKKFFHDGKNNERK